MEARYEQLFRRMALTGLAVALIPLYLVGVAIYIYFASTQEQNQRAQLQNLAINRTSAVQLFLDERIGMLEALFLDERIGMLEALAQTADLGTLTRPGELAKILEILNRRQHSFVDLGIIDAEGDHLAYHGPFALEDRNYGSEPWFEEAVLRGVHVSDVFLGFRRVSSWGSGGCRTSSSPCVATTSRARGFSARPSTPRSSPGSSAAVRSA
ncbi:MAG: hypothetical protein MUE90_08175 [Thermoanaerobaculales bacterium]|nr:hypothetical protein [Thermoanaerobaculales bacterium]